MLMGSVQEVINDTSKDLKDVRGQIHESVLTRWLKPLDASINYNQASRQRFEETGVWLLESDEYTTWKHTNSAPLWLHGIPGCGKTILSSAIIQDLSRGKTESNLFYFYFDFNDVLKRSVEYMIRTLVYQLSNSSNNDTRKVLTTEYERHQDGKSQPTFTTLSNTLISMLKSVGETWIVLDALDECLERERRGQSLMDLLKTVQEQACVHLILTSRRETDIERGASDMAAVSLEIQGNGIDSDIRKYTNYMVREDSGLARWRAFPDRQEEIETVLLHKANGM